MIKKLKIDKITDLTLYELKEIIGLIDIEIDDSKIPNSIKKHFKDKDKVV